LGGFRLRQILDNKQFLILSAKNVRTVNGVASSVTLKRGATESNINPEMLISLSEKAKGINGHTTQNDNL
jgi:hypothetical protein